MKIRNKSELVSHGNRRGRSVVLDLVEHALKVVDPYSATKKVVHIVDDHLVVGHLRFNLSDFGDIYVVGAGKATLPIAQALELILRDRIRRGVVIVKRGQKANLRRIRVIDAGHPIPDSAGLEGAKKIMNLVEGTRGGDILFSAMTGGSSALMPLPAEGISLDDKKRVTDLLLKSGASIQEINAVRKHISAIKGGHLVEHFHGDLLINLTVSDVIGDPLDYITDPTVPDTSSFEDAVSALKKYEIWSKAPASIRNYLRKAGPDLETPKDFRGLQFHSFILANNVDACRAVEERAKTLGLNSLILSTMIEGESREAGIVTAGIAKEIERFGRPIRKPCVVVSGGETTVTIGRRCGEGGPNQEFALGFATKLVEDEDIVLAALGTDGTDGPTEIAGGIVDNFTMNRAKKLGLDIFQSLKNHDSSTALRRLNDAIITGSTGTNVMDLRVMAIGAS